MTDHIVTRQSKIAKRVDVSGCRTIDMVLSESGTAWEPRLVVPDVAGAAATGFRAVVNPSNGRTLAFVQHKYRANSHTEHLLALEPLVRSGDILPHSVSSWDNGALLAYQFRVPSLEADIAPGRRVSSLLTLAFWHNGEGVDRSFLADFNWFCKNQLGLVRMADDTRGVRHVGQIVDRYAELVQQRIHSFRGAALDRYDAMRRMAAKPLRGYDALAYFVGALGEADVPKALAEVNDWARQFRATGAEPKGLVRQVRNIVDDYRADDAGAPLSVWHAYNGLTRYVTHTIGRNADVRARNALLGQGQETIDRAWRAAVQLAA